MWLFISTSGCDNLCNQLDGSPGPIRLVGLWRRQGYQTLDVSVVMYSLPDSQFSLRPQISDCRILWRPEVCWEHAHRWDGCLILRFCFLVSASRWFHLYTPWFHALAGIYMGAHQSIAESGQLRSSPHGEGQADSNEQISEDFRRRMHETIADAHATSSRPCEIVMPWEQPSMSWIFSDNELQWSLTPHQFGITLNHLDLRMEGTRSLQW